MTHRLKQYACRALAILLTGILMSALPGLPVARAAEPADMDALLAKSKTESRLQIYANVGSENWKVIVKAFNQKYPWIQVEPLDLGPAESFERYYAESAAGKHSADVIVVAAPTSWLRFVDKGELEPVDAAEGAQAPVWSKPFKGLYTFSTDPLILMYNKLTVPEQERPKSLAQLVELTRSDPKRFVDKITTYDATGHPFAEAAHWTYVHQRGAEGWKILEALGPVTRPENAGGSMTEKITTGEYSCAYFASGVTTFLRTSETGHDKILGWNLIADGTPVFARGIGITRHAVSKASARLFLEFVLSHDGQVAIGKAGLTPYRADVKKTEVPYLTYQGIVDTIGEKNVLLILYDRALVKEEESFLERWKKVFKL
jgi:iron(III) transport system substrate-binding protein